MISPIIRDGLGADARREQACYALQSALSGDRREDCIAVRNHGGISLILDGMKAHEGVAGMQAAACGLLWKMALVDGQTRKMVRDSARWRRDRHEMAR